MQKYEQIKLLGQGSYGKAILGRRKSDGYKVCIKEVRLANLGQKEKHDAMKEIQVLSSLDHPYIVKYIESFQERGNLFIVMEFADGGDLSQKIENQGTTYFEEEEIMQTFIQMALAIKYIHDKKILHRDLKGQNIFLMKDGTVKLGDFGIARVLEYSQQFCNTQIGTPYYLSPEICQGKNYNSKTDIWSLGCILYEMCALKHAFDASNLNALIMNIVTAKPSPIPRHYSNDLKDLVDKMLTKDPVKRPNIKQILALPFLKNRLSDFLTKTLSLKKGSNVFTLPKQIDSTQQREAERMKWAKQQQQEQERRKQALYEEEQQRKRELKRIEDEQKRLREEREREALREVEKMRKEEEEEKKQAEIMRIYMQQKKEREENKRKNMQELYGGKEPFSYGEDDSERDKRKMAPQQEQQTKLYTDERRRIYEQQQREAMSNKQRAMMDMRGDNMKNALYQGDDQYSSDNGRQRGKKGKDSYEDERRNIYNEQRAAAKANKERVQQLEMGGKGAADALKSDQNKQDVKDSRQQDRIANHEIDAETRRKIYLEQQAAVKANKERIKQQVAELSKEYQSDSESSSARHERRKEKKKEITPEERREAYNEQRAIKKKAQEGVSKSDLDELKALEAELNQNKKGKKPPPELAARLQKKEEPEPPKKEKQKHRIVKQEEMQVMSSASEPDNTMRDSMIENRAWFIQEALCIDEQEADEEPDFGDTQFKNNINFQVKALAQKPKSVSPPPKQVEPLQPKNSKAQQNRSPTSQSDAKGNKKSKACLLI